MTKMLNGEINLAFEGDDGNKGQIIVNGKEPPPPTTTPVVAQRQQWASPMEFLLSCIAMSVGLGNIWRFPATAIKNGGGAFLLPYLTVLFLIGRPLYYMELCMGQFASYGCVKVWEMVPAMRGIGYGQIIGLWGIVTYYVSLMAITMYYFFASFSAQFPWIMCPPNATDCFDHTMNSTGMNMSNKMSSAERYFIREVTKSYDKGLDDGIFLPDTMLTLCLLGSWAILFLILGKGVKSSGKAAYFTALFPYFVLIILLIRGAFLPGAGKGIAFFFTPDFGKLLELDVWRAAVGQCFFSLSVGFGSATMLASYNSFEHNVYRDAYIISVTDTLTSIIAGATTFGIMGYLAEQMGIDDITDVLREGGTTLAFVSYPDVLIHLGWYPQVFALLFFSMLFTLGVGSASALTAAVITAICDKFPNFSKWKITLIVCVAGFLLGLIYVTPQGQYVLELVDAYLAELSIYILALCEVVSVNWIYGYTNFINDIEFMLGRKTGFYWKFCWKFFIPVTLTTIIIGYFISMKSLTKGQYVFGPISNGVAIALALACVSVVPILIVKTFLKYHHKSSKSKWSTLYSIFFEPSPKWGPIDPEIKKKYLEAKCKGLLSPASADVSRQTTSVI